MKGLLSLFFDIKLLLYLLLFFLFACGGSDSRYIAKNALQTDTIRIDVDDAKKSSYLDMFEKIDCLLIPYDSIFCIGKVDKLLVVDSSLLLKNSKISRGIYVWNRKGCPVTAIHKTGIAPDKCVVAKELFCNKVMV